MHTTPVSLIERLRHPADHESWSRFVQLYTPFLHAWSRRLGLDENDAADLVQDVFIQLMHALPKFTYDRGRSFRSWLYSVTQNKWREVCRRRRPQPVNDDFAPLADLAAQDEHGMFVEEEYQSYVSQRVLQLIQKEFSPPTWQAFWKFVVEDQPAAEVAQAVGSTVNAVYLARGRVLRRLREEVKDLLD